MQIKLLVSIIIPNLHSPIIDKVITALLKQDYNGKYEIIVIGQDKYHLLEKFKTKNQIKIITAKKPENAATNRNIGIKEAQGEYLLFIDADCLAQPNLIKQHIKNYSVNQNQVVCGSFVIEKSTNFWQFCDNLSHFHTFSSKRKRGAITSICSANFSIPRAILNQIGNFNEKLTIGEDLDMSFRIIQAKYPLLFEPNAQIIHLPNRKSFFSVVQHAYSWGRISLQIRIKYSKIKKMPFFMRNRLTLICMLPIIAIGVATKIFLSLPFFIKYIYSWPVIICTKIAWCMGAILNWHKKINV